MLDVFGFPSPQQSNYQEFYGGGSTRDWVKPRGASMVRFMLIGPGGNGAVGSSGAGGGGGGSGAVTSWIGPAIFVPDSLRIVIGTPTSGTAIVYQAKNGSGYTLLSASSGGAGIGNNGGAGAAAMTANYFTAAGIFNSVAGQAGANAASTAGLNDITASSTTFLSGGAGGSDAIAVVGGGVTPNYGYVSIPVTTAGGSVVGANGYFITQPILVGTGGAGGTTNESGTSTRGGNAGIGCGGGGSGEDRLTTFGLGGDGAVFVWSW
tara:strand:- start:41 stop:832 length:792 start_codon:yes stop_codon:yes gene_type:complete